MVIKKDTKRAAASSDKPEKVTGVKRTWERKEKTNKGGLCEESVPAPKKRESKAGKFPFKFVNLFELDDKKKPYKKPTGGKAKKGAPEAPVMNRRQKQKVSDLVKNLRLNYNQLLMKKKEKGPEAKDLKHGLVGKSIDLIGDKWLELCYKHDGSRILQSLLKFGNRVHRVTIVNHLSEHFVELATSKYAHYLASKMYYYAPENEQKADMRKQMTG